MWRWRARRRKRLRVPLVEVVHVRDRQGLRLPVHRHGELVKEPDLAEHDSPWRRRPRREEPDLGFPLVTSVPVEAAHVNLDVGRGEQHSYVSELDLARVATDPRPH